MSNVKFGLGDFMKKYGYSIQDIHERTGISRNTISTMVNNTSKGVRFETLDILMQAYNLKITDILVENYNLLKDISINISSVNDLERDGIYFLDYDLRVEVVYDTDEITLDMFVSTVIDRGELVLLTYHCQELVDYLLMLQDTERFEIERQVENTLYEMATSDYKSRVVMDV